MNRLKNLLMSVLLLASLALFASSASASAPPTTPLPADGSAPFKVATNDYFIGVILKGFLGDILQKDAASAQTAISGAGTLGEVFRTFNLGVAFFGTLIILFITIVGVLQSGNDGEFLGRRWSSMWVPIRFSVGSALMLPLTSSGYSMVQAMVLWIAMQGVGFADSVWATIVKTMVTRTTSQVWGSVPAADIARDVVTSSVCAQAINRYTAKNPVPYVVRYTTSNVTSGKYTTVESRWGMPGVTVSGVNDDIDAICGKFVYTYPAPDSSDQYSPVRQAIAAEHVKLMGDITTALNGNGDITALLDALESTQPDAAKAISDAEQQIQKDIALYTKYYLTNINKVADDAMTAAIPADQQSQAQAMTDIGFVAAGAMYIDLTRLHTAVRTTMSATPKYTGPKTGTISSTVNSDQAVQVMRFLTDMAADLSQNVAQDPSQTSAWDASGTNVNTTSSITAIMPTKSSMKAGPENAMQTMWSGLSSQIVQTIVGVGDSQAVGNHVSYNPFDHITAPGNNNQSVVLQLKNRGDMILDIVGVVQTVQIGLSGVIQGASDEAQAGGVVSAVFTIAFWTGIARGVLAAAMPILGGLILAMLAFGLSLAVYIPMVPYTLWTAGIVGLVVLIAEALVASSLWAVMIMHPSGEGITSEQSKQGMMMLLVLFTRPALMLMGMIMGMFMVEPLVTMVNDTFFYAMKSVQYGTGLTGLYSIIGYCALYTSIVLSIINRCFAMIHTVPDRVLRWVGGGGEQLGESDMGSSAGAGLKAAAAGASGAIGSGVAREAEKARDRRRAQLAGIPSPGGVSPPNQE